MKTFQFTLQPYHPEPKFINFRATDVNHALKKLKKWMDVSGTKPKYFPTYVVEIKDENKNRRTTK